MTRYKATAYNLMVLQPIEEVMLIGKGDPGTKETGIHACNTLLPVRITDPQLKVGDIIDLGSSVTIRIVIWAVYAVISMKYAGGGGI